MAALPIGQGYSASQWEAWLNANTKGQVLGASTTYQGTQLKGKTWAQVYQVVYSYGLSQGVTAPDDAAAATEEIMTLGTIGTAAAELAQGAANATSASAQGTAAGAADIASTVSNPLNYLSGIAGFFGDLTQASTWIRVAKVIVGGVLLIVGAARLAGADKAVKQIASKVPVVPV